MSDSFCLIYTKNEIWKRFLALRRIVTREDIIKHELEADRRSVQKKWVIPSIFVPNSILKYLKDVYGYVRLIVLKNSTV